MEKIKLKINYDLLVMVNEALAVASNIYSKSNKFNNIAKSIINQVTIKLIKKQINNIHTKKVKTISLEYYEAAYLEVYLRATLVYQHNLHKLTAIRVFTDEINQLLA